MGKAERRRKYIYLYIFIIIFCPAAILHFNDRLPIITFLFSVIVMLIAYFLINVFLFK